MGKYTATFTCDRELWDDFKNWARTQNSSASEELSKFMQACTVREVDEQAHYYIDNIIKERVQSFIDTRLQQLIDERYQILSSEKQRNEIKIAQITSIDDQVPSDIDLYMDAKLEDTDNTDNTDNHQKDKTDNAIKSASKELNNQNNILSSTNKKNYYSDQEVAKIEGISAASICRYRQGQRTPRDKSFFERWEYLKNQKKWIKLNIKP